jgi:hypothetical protein
MSCQDIAGVDGETRMSPHDIAGAAEQSEELDVRPRRRRTDRRSGGPRLDAGLKSLPG